MFEKIPASLHEQSFAKETSLMKDAYTVTHTETPRELHQFFHAEDQKLMQNGLWDCKNDTLLLNQVKDSIENVDVGGLLQEEVEEHQDMLWLWYHHAISNAIYKYRDKVIAQAYADKAVAYKSKENSNQITGILHLLVHDQVEEASKLASSITDYEKQTAFALIDDYKSGEFF